MLILSVTGKDIINIQAGPNANQKIEIPLPNTWARAIGFANGLPVLDHISATNSISVVDKARGNISAHRSRLGAIANRLEHAKTNADNTSENLQHSESRIRDVDMAKEMVGFSKYQILEQASQAMLAQANKSTQGILGLLNP